MTKQTVSKREIAQEYLDAAIEFFLARVNFFCTIHLAAAAEELFGAHLPENERIFTFACRAEKALMSEHGVSVSDADARRSVNEWKNEIKHMGNASCNGLSIDPVFAAEHHIEEALVNFYKLNLRKSAAIHKFEARQNRRRV